MPMAISAAPKSVIALSIILLAVAAIFGALNTYKVTSLRGNVTEATAARDAAEGRRMQEQKTRDAGVAAAKAKATENESRIAKAEAELVQLQTEKADL